MTDASSESRIKINRRLLTAGVVLMWTGVVLDVVGAVAASAALIGAARRWMRQGNVHGSASGTPAA